MKKIKRRDFVKSAGILSAGISLQPKSRVGAGGNPGIIDEIKAHKKGIAAWWTGQNGWLIKSDDILIGTDLVLASFNRIEELPITPGELASVIDYSFVTHEHSDHFERVTSKTFLEHGKCKFIMPVSCLDAAHKEMNIPDNRIIVAEPRKPLDIGEIRVEPIRAIHGNSNFAVYYDANLEDCGYMINIGGKRILQMGDTILLEDHLRQKDVDVLLFSPTEHNTYIDQSVILINALTPEYILPQHRDTFTVTPENRFWTNGYPWEVKIRLSKELQKRYNILSIGEKIEIV
ncbi:MBL fold metallo-hydrolase [Bacteroidota bacterium]